MIQQSEEYKNFGNEIIKELFPELRDVAIAWLASDEVKKSKGRLVFAECAVVPEKYRWCCDYDFTITVYEPNIEDFTRQQVKILLEHELMHIGFTDKGKPYAVPHDVEEFMEIIKKYGLEWQRTAPVDYALLED